MVMRLVQDQTKKYFRNIMKILEIYGHYDYQRLIETMHFYTSIPVELHMKGTFLHFQCAILPQKDTWDMT